LINKIREEIIKPLFIMSTSNAFTDDVSPVAAPFASSAKIKQDTDDSATLPTSEFNVDSSKEIVLSSAGTTTTLLRP
jgi:hypothetical protein